MFIIINKYKQNKNIPKRHSKNVKIRITIKKRRSGGTKKQ